MSRNPEYQFVSTDTASLVSALTAAYEKITDRTLNPADPDRIFISWVADVIIQERAMINYVANQNLPSRADGANLDALGELIYSVKRLEATAATCTVRFTISEPCATSVLIPAGTRVTDKSRTLVWSTAADVYIPIGELSADVTVRCATVGAIGNGYTAGQINTLIDVDSVLYFAACANIDTSAGGAERASDDEYYKLMRQGMDAFSVEGPRGAYVYWAKSVSTGIADAVAISPTQTRSESISIYTRGGERVGFIGGNHIKLHSLAVCGVDGGNPAKLGTDYTAIYSEGLLKITLANDGALSEADQVKVTVDQEKAGYVYIYALMNDGTIADEAIKSAIYAACNDDAIRPLTDYVVVEDPEVVHYDVQIKYFVPSDTEISPTDLETAVSKAVDEYVAWQGQRLGRDINPSYLNYLLMKTGIKRVEISSPVFTKLHDGSDNTVPQVAFAGNITIVNGGYENE